jgi:hypothetical protein
MRGDEQADIRQSEDGEGILVDPVHAPNLKLGSGGSVFTLSPSFTVPHSTINGIQVTTMFLGTAVTFWLDSGEQNSGIHPEHPGERGSSRWPA